MTLDFNPKSTGGKIMRVSLVFPSQHEVCQPNRKPLSNLFGDTMAYHMYRGYGIVDTTTGGKCEI